MLIINNRYYLEFYSIRDIIENLPKFEIAKDHKRPADLLATAHFAAQVEKEGNDYYITDGVDRLRILPDPHGRQYSKIMEIIESQGAIYSFVFRDEFCEETHEICHFALSPRSGYLFLEDIHGRGGWRDDNDWGDDNDFYDGPKPTPGSSLKPSRNIEDRVLALAV
jgi:hypothetical protein